jgi:hypothetical protein
MNPVDRDAPELWPGFGVAAFAAVDDDHVLPVGSAGVRGDPYGDPGAVASLHGFVVEQRDRRRRQCPAQFDEDAAGDVPGAVAVEAAAQRDVAGDRLGQQVGAAPVVGGEPHLLFGHGHATAVSASTIA